jgi:hypothetical protein
MGVLIKLFGKHAKNNNRSRSQVTIDKHSEKEIFTSPTLLANWVFQHAVEIFSVKDDFRHAPSNEIKDKLNITHVQIERLAREESILRAVGASLFIKKKYDIEFYNKYFSNLYPSIALHIYDKPNEKQVADIKETLEEYINFISNEEDNGLSKFSEKYITRIYYDNSHYIKMLASDIPKLAINSSLAIHDALRRTYLKISQEQERKR